MRILDEGYERVVKLLRKPKQDARQRYRLSNFCIPFSERGVHLLENTFTGQIWRLADHEWDNLLFLQAHEADARFIEESSLAELLRNRSIVELENDDCEEYLSMLEILRIMRKPPDGYESYVIFPTTGCNASCVYCFESGYVKQAMTEETAQAVVDFVERTHADTRVKLRWFGGEPLVAASRIDLICEEVAKRGIDFSSSIVTNASLVTPELVKRAKELWRLGKAQVSLDGDRASYEARKRYADPERHNFDSVLRGIHALDDEGIKVALRCNYDADNLGGLMPFVEELHQEFAQSQNVSLYFAMLFGERERQDAPPIVRSLREIEDRASELGLLGEKKRRRSSFRTNLCMADDMDRCVVIEPNGYLQHCESLFDCNRYGTIWDGVTDQARFEELKQLHKVEACCKRCPFLPECTPFKKKGCPDERSDYCREFRLAERENALHRLAAKQE